MTKEVWLSSLGKLSERDTELCSRAYDVLMGNVYKNEGYPWSPYRCISPCKSKFAGIWNWDSAFHAMGAANWDTQLAKESIIGFFKYQKDNGLLPDVIFEEGRVVDCFTKPPVFAMAAMRIYEKDGDKAFLESIYPALCKNAAFYENNRCYNGLFHYDCDEKDIPEYETFARFESGWDNAVRWDGGLMNMWAIDLNCFMVLFYRKMAKIAKIVGKTEDISTWEAKEEALAKLINEKFWNPESKHYSDTDRFTEKVSDVLSPASFMPLFVGIASKEQAEAMGKIAVNNFCSKMPTVSFDNPAYCNDYWRGPTWLNVAYFAAKGLKDYGLAVADDIKESILNMCFEEKRGIFENYDSKTGEGLYCDAFSWSSVFIIEFVLNF